MCKQFIIDLKETARKLANLFQMTKIRGMSPMWTHYWVEDKKGQKVIGATTCVLLDENFDPVSMGTTIRGKTDLPAKVMGRYWSLKRAYDMAIAVSPRDAVFIPVPKKLRKQLNTSTVFQAVPTEFVDEYLTDIEKSRIEEKKERLRRLASTQVQQTQTA